jgi:hypothetical protein
MVRAPNKETNMQPTDIDTLSRDLIESTARAADVALLAIHTDDRARDTLRAELVASLASLDLISDRLAVAG